MGVDIGLGTTKAFTEVLSQAQTVIWNGPMGAFEKSQGGYSAGTKAIAQKLQNLAEQGADVIIGGGDTGKAISDSGVDASRMFISTGGGATMEFLASQGKLPVLENLAAQDGGNNAAAVRINNEAFAALDNRLSVLGKGEILPITVLEMEAVLTMIRRGESLAEVQKIINALSLDQREELRKIAKDYFSGEVEKVEAMFAKDGGAKKEAQPAAVGGIDLRSLPLNALSLSKKAAVPAVISTIPVAQLEKEWNDLQKAIQSGPMPYAKLKEHVRNCYGRAETAQHLQQVSDYVMNVLKLEEQAAVETAPELKDVLCCLS